MVVYAVSPMKDGRIVFMTAAQLTDLLNNSNEEHPVWWVYHVEV